MSNRFLNVHIFDGQLKDIFTPSQEYTNDDKKIAFENLLPQLSNPIAIETVHTIINDIGKPNNFQPENNVDCSDILMEIIKLTKDTDIIVCLDEQLADAKNLGICPSGRVTRLIQLWSAYKDHDEEKKNNK